MQHIHLKKINSTNSYLRELIHTDPDLKDFTYVTTYDQSEGKGQRGNSWEATPGKNISLSLLIRPDVATAPFDLNIVSSLALYDILTDKFNLSQVSVKWPNDIMVKDKKIGGILTENEWIGNSWEYAIIGIGLNVHQVIFKKYVPEATSIDLEMRQREKISYQSWHHPLAESIVLMIRERLIQLYSSPKSIRAEYLNHLYRFRENASYMTSDGRVFQGKITNVLPTGIIEIMEEDVTHKFAFKEVRFI